MADTSESRTRRLELAQAVWGVIAERGIEGVTFRRVAAEAGASVGRIQHYYDSRESLVRDSCRLMIEMAAQAHEDSAGAARDPEQELEGLVLHSVPGNLATRRGTAIWLAYQAKGVDDPAVRELVSEAESGAVDRAAALIADVRARRPAAVQAPSAERLALELMALAQGVSMRVLTGSMTSEDATALLVARLARDGLSGS